MAKREKEERDGGGIEGVKTRMMSFIDGGNGEESERGRKKG